MDIEYLLFLQEFRNSTNDLHTPFLENLSLFAVTYLILLPVLIYWMVDKKSGLYTLCSYAACCGVNAVVKLTVCAYRPWIRDARVLPAGNAITTATGYSFPSGHTVTAGPIYGGMAVSAWKKIRWVSVVCIVLFLLTAFSRNYLGVHTPQDVIVGSLESILWLFLIARLFRYLQVHPEKENLFLLISFILGWIFLAYITLKPYPMTYVDGKLLVDPKKMMRDGYADICLLIAFPVARFVERKWINFKAAGLDAKGIIVSLIGLVPLVLCIMHLKPALTSALGDLWGAFMYTFITVFYYIALYPIVIKAVCNKTQEAENQNTER
jgi:membrane-associated phospholipid phosphatase